MQSKLILLYGLASHQLQETYTYGAHTWNQRAEQPWNIHQKHSISVILALNLGSRVSDIWAAPEEEVEEAWTCWHLPWQNKCVYFYVGTIPLRAVTVRSAKKMPWPINQRWFNKTREFKQRLSKLMKTSIDKPAIWTDPSSPRRIFPAFTSLRLKKIHKQSQTTKSRRAASILPSIWSPTAQLELCPRGRWSSNLSSVTLKFTHFTEHSCHMGWCKTLFLLNKCKCYLWICPFLCR